VIARALIVLALAGCLTAVIAGIYFEGKRSGKSECAEKAALVREAAQAAADSAASAAAKAIAGIKVQNRTVYSEVQRDVIEKPVYRDCEHPAGQLQRINAALTGEQPEPAGRGLVPPADAASGLQLRRDDAQADRGGRAVP
jgi:hypothetical protein